MHWTARRPRHLRCRRLHRLSRDPGPLLLVLWSALSWVLSSALSSALSSVLSSALLSDLFLWDPFP